MEQLYNYLPRELVTFILVTLFSLLIGLSQRRISLKREGETTLFGTDHYYYYNSPDYLLYCSHCRHAAIVVLRDGNCDCIVTDRIEAYLY